MFGFTCGLADLLLIPEAEKQRHCKLSASAELGFKVHKRFAGLDGDHDPSMT